MGELINVKRHDTPLGASGTDVVGKIHNADDHISSLQGFQAAQIYEKMRRSDTQIRKILNAIINPIKSATWTVEPASDDSKDIEAAALIDQVFFKDLNFTKFLNEALTCIPHGYSAFEVVHENKQNKNIGPYTGFAQLGFRRQTTITEWNHDKITGALIEIKQESFSDIQVNTKIPAEFLVIFFSEQEGDNIGFPLLRNVYGPYKRKLMVQELQMIGIERFAIPTPILKVPKLIKQSDPEYTDAVDVLKNFVSAEDAFLTYPEGWELELHNNIFDPEKLTKVLKAEDENMASAILASFLELGTGGNAGAYALSADLSDFFFAGLIYYANIIKDTINNNLINQLMTLNYGDSLEQNPKISYSGISDNAGEELMRVITGFVSSQVIQRDEPLEDYVRKLFKLPKKAEGDMIDNQRAQGDINGSSQPDDSDDDDNSNQPILDNDNNKQQQAQKLSELGHRHKGTGPTIKKGKLHYHDLLDSEGNIIGRVSSEKDGPAHTHIIDSNKITSGPIDIKEEKIPSNNPASLIASHEIIITDVIRKNLKAISDKYINDVIRNYERLGSSQKLRAVQNVKIGLINSFRKELRMSMTTAARESLDMVKSEIPNKKNVKLSENKSEILKEFEYQSFKFNDFSSLPKRVQVLIAWQAGKLADKEAQEVADSVAFAFTSNEASTNDIDVLKNDLKQAADRTINSGARELAAVNAASTMVNETRNTFMFSDEVINEIASVTFTNPDPKSEICTLLNGTTFEATDPDALRYQTPLHHNCKSYYRVNLKTSTNKPEITGLPPITEAAKKSITFKEGCC